MQHNGIVHMKSVVLPMIVLAAFSLAACSNQQRYRLDQAEYSAWNNNVMQYRKKAVLIDTETGDTWGLAYDKSNPTEDGYAWQKIPKQ